ncbi:MAG: hypothetical protein CFE23_02140 [Flavobacterium sp. BFFFF1]|nr:MAG: hypothetical protein CFE23_02140 [Flavobacterium sp. BFFFF1]
MAGIFVTAIYFIPTIIARDKKNLKYIFIGNLLTGWTGVGWLLALLWAIRSESNPNLIVPKKKKKKKQKNEIQNID